MLASSAVRGTLAAIVMLAVLAVVGVLGVHRASTVVASTAVPIIQPDVWTIRAVGIQDAPDKGEEVADSAFLQSRSNGSKAIAFTESLITDMRMGD